MADIDDENYELIEEGPGSTVYRAKSSTEDGKSGWVVVKTATTVRKFSKEPHDIIKELRILSSISHINIISVLDHFGDANSSALSIWMPYIPISLSQVLTSPRFSPHPSPAGDVEGYVISKLEARFDIITRSVMYQTFSALSHLHDVHTVAHRDIKPNNILLTPDGYVQLIDFGISWKESDNDENRDDLWPEHHDRMYFEVSTGPYRAPELLFGTRSYDPFAIDIWSLGASFAEFFTPLRLKIDEDEDGEDDGDNFENTQPAIPFIVPKGHGIYNSELNWSRDPLFNGRRGEIGLAWSIFKIFGTPTVETWPEFEELPDAKGITFNVVPPVCLSQLLPNLPPTRPDDADGTPQEATTSGPLDLLSKLLVYPASSRIRPISALSHSWFSTDILLPREYPLENIGPERCGVNEIGGKTLGQYLQEIVSSDS